MGRKTTVKREETEEREPVPCAHETCGVYAKCRVLTPTGWANLCEQHYVRYHDNIARKRFTELGLDRGVNESAAAHKVRVFAHLKRMAKPKTFADAEKLEDEWAT